MSIAHRARHPSAARALAVIAVLSALATSAGAATANFRGWVPGKSWRTYDVDVGMHDNTLWVRAVPGHDIDCWLYDEDDVLVDADTDSSSTCLLYTPGLGVHRLVVRNWANGGTTFIAEQD